MQSNCTAPAIFHSLKLNTMTILKTQTAIINRKTVTVETITDNDRAQSIAYRINGNLIPFDAFWGMKPKFKG